MQSKVLSPTLNDMLYFHSHSLSQHTDIKYGEKSPTLCLGSIITIQGNINNENI